MEKLQLPCGETIEFDHIILKREDNPDPLLSIHYTGTVYALDKEQAGQQLENVEILIYKSSLNPLITFLTRLKIELEK